jgi:arylsulfatase
MKLTAFALCRWNRGQADSAKFSNCAVRNQRFRFVNNKELYDLPADPLETTNVATKHRESVEVVRRSYDA